ncbi:Rv2629 family ribosome hibernation factor [Saccharothrix sp. ALI-22-I]|uniref:Rv2629 family ribosome hibernation factor n=1 Tax=Saccharothrix sp. ALI-22-I TaxID=1933778 RepID=UPI0011798A34|nr:Vms1/Ankzf1 family peptidyl-tRNA hydrolase [Saccharothrix sp. ALI-22-I]
MSSLGELVRQRGPFASVYLDASHDTEDAAKAMELRWRGVRQELARQGADEATLDAMEGAALEPVVGKSGRALIAAHGRLLLDRVLPRPPAVETVRWSDLPHLLPLATWTEPTVPHVVVLVDRAGADLHGYDGRGERATEVHGEEHPLHKIGGGGWAHKRLQNTVEETARRNAMRVAEEADRLVSEVDARLLILGGEVQARADVREQLSLRCRDVLIEVEGATLAEGGDDAAFDHAVQSLVAQYQFDLDNDVVEEFTAQSGRPDGLAVQGLAPVVEALREAKVAALLVSDPAVGDRTVWSGDDPAQVALRENDLRGLGVEHVGEHRADEALGTAAAATGAQVVVVDVTDLREGVGALLRY